MAKSKENYHFADIFRVSKLQNVCKHVTMRPGHSRIVSEHFQRDFNLNLIVVTVSFKEILSKMEHFVDFGAPIEL